MTALELFQLATSGGVLAGGAGIWRWVLSTERRILRLEIKARIAGA